MSLTNSKSLPWITLTIASVMLVIGNVTSTHVFIWIALVFYVISLVFFVVQLKKLRKEKKELEALKKEEVSEPEGLKSEIVGVINTEE